MGEKSVLVITVFSIVCGTILIMSCLQYMLKRPKAAKSRELEEISARLARLEQSVDAIAVEAERIGEGQRFTTKLLSEREPVHREHQ